MLPTCRNKQKQSLTVSLYSVVLPLAPGGSCWLLWPEQGQTLQISFFISLFPHSFFKMEGGGGEREIGSERSSRQNRLRQKTEKKCGALRTEKQIGVG